MKSKKLLKSLTAYCKALFCFHDWDEDDEVYRLVGGDTIEHYAYCPRCDSEKWV